MNLIPQQESLTCEQLVPQDPHDEPATALLARIKAEREAQSAKTRKTGKGKA